MKMLKKALSFILCLALMLSCVAGMHITVSAEESTKLELAFGEYEFVDLSDEESSKYEAKLAVPVKVDSNPGINVLSFNFTYDTDAFEVIEVKHDELPEGWMAVAGPTDNNPIKIVYAYVGTGIDDQSYSGTCQIAEIYLGVLDKDAATPVISISGCESGNIIYNENGEVDSKTTIESEDIVAPNEPVTLPLDPDSVINTQVVQKGRNLEYKDMIYVIDVFQLIGVEDIDLSKDAGLLSWTIDEYEAEGFEIAFDEEHATVGLQVYPDSPDKDNPYYFGKSNGIFTKNLSEQKYYVGYVKLANDEYVYSEARLYGPKDYAYNMLGKANTGASTKELCVALLNYISAAQKYFNKDIADELLVNKDLDSNQKEIDWETLSQDINLADPIPEGVSVERDNVVFNKAGQNLIFDEMISLVAAYVTTNNDDIVNANECGTIFWTSAEQLEAIGDNPTKDNYGSGTKVTGFKVYQNQTGQWYSSAPAVAPKDMADTEYFFMSYVVKADGSVSYSGIFAYNFEQYIYNTVTKGNATAEMVEFAKRLFVYERAAKTALKTN